VRIERNFTPKNRLSLFGFLSQVLDEEDEAVSERIHVRDLFLDARR